MRDPIPTFETERLLLKPLDWRHVDDIQKNFEDYDVVRYLSALVPWPYPRDGAQKFLEMVLPSQGQDRWLWAIFVKPEEDESVGVVDLWRPGRPENRGFWLARKHWSKGYMTEAVVPITDYAFETLGFEVLRFTNAVGNVASRRVKEKSGASFLGTRAATFVDPAITENELWELSKVAWLNHRCGS